MSPKKVVPVGADDIIELTDIVESGVLPADSSITDASFEDELDSMLAEAPELAAVGGAMEADSAMSAEASAAPPVGDEELADLDSLLDDLGDDIGNAKPPAPKDSAPAPGEDITLDVDDLLAESAAATPVKSAAAPTPDPSAEIDAFMAEFSDAGATATAGNAPAAQAEQKVLDGASTASDDLLAELLSPAKKASEEDDLLAELESMMGGGTETPAPKAAPAPEPEPIVEAEPEAAPEPENAVDPESAPSAEEILEETAAPEAAFAAEMLDADAPAAEGFPSAVTEEMVTPAVEDNDLVDLPAMAPDAEAAPLGDEDLQHLDALLDDILQPGATIAAATDSATPPQDAAGDVSAEVSEPEIMTEEALAAAPAPDSAAIAAELMAEDGPLFAAVRELIAQEMEARIAALEERLAQNLDKTAAKAAAKVIREEIAALMQDME